MYGLLSYSTNLSKSDASDCWDLIFGDVSNCAFHRMGMNALYESLPKGIIWGEENWDRSTIQVYENPSVGNIEIAEDKGWLVNWVTGK